MKIGMLCIGDELLDGRTTNTNTTWLGDQLVHLGHDLIQVMIVKDRLEEIHYGLEVLQSNCDFVFTSGGIGPTEDDITVASIANFFSKELQIDLEEISRIENLYKSRGLKFIENAKKQALRPADGEFITNPKGVASGLYWPREKILTLAGVPTEFYGIFLEFLKKHPEFNESKNFTPPLEWNIYGTPEGRIDDMATKLPRSSEAYATYRIIYPCVELRLMKEENQDNIFAWKKTFDPLAYSFQQGEKLEEVLLKKCKSQQVELLCVESCTGGLVSKLITDIPGSSEVFVGSLVTYTNFFKSQIGVSTENLERHGAVSEEVLKEMLVSGFNFLPPNTQKKSRLVLAVTGYAGDSNNFNDDNIGTVHVGVSIDNQKVNTHQFQFGKRSREQIRLLSSAAAMRMALDLLS